MTPNRTHWIGIGIAVSVALAGFSEGRAGSASADGHRSGPTAPFVPDTVGYAATFDSVWSRIGNTHYDPELAGVDWDGARRELRPRALAADTPEGLREVIRELLDRLGESHFVLIPGDAAPAFASDAPAPPGGGDPGLDFRWSGDELLVTRAQGSGAAAGVRPGWVLEGIEGTTVNSLAGIIRQAAPPGEEERQVRLWLPVDVRSRTAGAQGTVVTARFRDGEEVSRTVEILRGEPWGEEVRFGNLPPIRQEASHRIESHNDLRIGVLRFSAWFPAVVPQVARAIDEMRDVDGLVLDLRGNPGGVGGLVIGIGGHFFDERVDLGEMRTRDSTLRFFANPQRVSPDGSRVEPYGGALAILVDPLTASTSEIFAAGMQALGRARVFGEPTAGQALPALVVGLPNGDRLMHAIADFTAPNGSRLEGEGVIPDVYAPPTRSALLAGQDLAFMEAVRWIREQTGNGDPPTPR